MLIIKPAYDNAPSVAILIDLMCDGVRLGLFVAVEEYWKISFMRLHKERAAATAGAGADGL